MQVVESFMACSTQHMYFPCSIPARFYFVSDPTLLEILSLGSDPPSVVPHFQSGLFDSLTNVTFDKTDKTRMLEMFSQQSEKVCCQGQQRGSHLVHCLACARILWR